MPRPEFREESNAYTAAGFTTAACIVLLVMAMLAMTAPRSQDDWGLLATAELLAALLFMTVPSVILLTAIIWGIPTIVASGLSYPLTMAVIPLIRRHAFVRPWSDIAYGVALGLVWSGALALLTRASGATIVLMGTGALTGVLWGFWFWWFERCEQRAHPGNS